MALSLVICSRNRAERLRATLAKLDIAAMARVGVDLVLVDSASDDDTSAVMTEFGRTLSIPAQVMLAPQPGASIARNIGARAARSDVLIFTDDDCYLDDGYFDAANQAFDPAQFQYAGGSTLLFDPADANSGVIRLPYDVTTIVPPGTLLHAGMFQGSNLIFDRAAFEKIGGFDVRLGAGTPFFCEDIELCTRASLAGYAGAFLPQLIVLHHHGRKLGTPELAAAELGYDRGRGAYYAQLMARGVRNVWDLWSSWRIPPKPEPMPARMMNIMKNEMRGAADYFEMLLEGPPPKDEP